MPSDKEEQVLDQSSVEGGPSISHLSDFGRIDSGEVSSADSIVILEGLRGSVVPRILVAISLAFGVLSCKGEEKIKPLPVQIQTPEALDLAKKRRLMELLLNDSVIVPPSDDYHVTEIARQKRQFNGEALADYDYDPVIEYVRMINWERMAQGDELLRLINSQQILIEGIHRLISGDDLKKFHKICQDKGVPFDLIFLALAESGWSDAVSRTGAAGPWQLMPNTARGRGLRVDGEVDERNDVERSTEVAIDHFKEGYDLTFKWDKSAVPKNHGYNDNRRFFWALVIYNAGRGRVEPLYHKAKGDPGRYPAVAKTRESKEYAAKTFAVTGAAKDYVRARTVEELSTPYLAAESRLRSDDMVAQYLARVSTMTADQKVQALMALLRQYEAEMDNVRADANRGGRIVADLSPAFCDKARVKLRMIMEAILYEEGEGRILADLEFELYKTEIAALGPKMNGRRVNGVIQAYDVSLSAKHITRKQALAGQTEVRKFSKANWRPNANRSGSREIKGVHSKRAGGGSGGRARD